MNYRIHGGLLGRCWGVGGGEEVAAEEEECVGKGMLCVQEWERVREGRLRRGMRKRRCGLEGKGCCSQGENRWCKKGKGRCEGILAKGKDMSRLRGLSGHENEVIRKKGETLRGKTT